MKELKERSLALAETILRNPALLGELSARIHQVLKDKVDLPEDQVYCFVPRVYRRPLFLPEVFIAAAEDADIFDPGVFPGPLDPWVVKVLDAQRLAGAEARRPQPDPWHALRDRILADRDLLGELSEAISQVLTAHGVTLNADETFAFEARTMPRPLFTSQISATPIPLPGPARMPHIPRVLEVIRDSGTWIPGWTGGVPPPDMLAVLERMRLDRSVAIEK
jgi:hypothetical protein